MCTVTYSPNIKYNVVKYLLNIGCVLCIHFEIYVSNEIRSNLIIFSYIEF